MLVATPVHFPFLEDTPLGFASPSRRKVGCDRWYESQFYKPLRNLSLTLNEIPNDQLKINLGGRVFLDYRHRLIIILRGNRRLIINLRFLIIIRIKGKWVHAIS